MSTPDIQRVYWPRGPKTATLEPLAPRLDTLEGKKIAFLWDYMFRGDEIFPLLEKQLSARYPGMSFVNYDAFGSTHGEDEHQIIADLPDKLKALKVDAVISAMGC